MSRKKQNVELPAAGTRDGLLSTGDAMFYAAVKAVFETGQASVSMLQRRLKLGYSQAARYVDTMEDLGIVGPFEGSSSRQILMTEQQFCDRFKDELTENMKNSIEIRTDRTDPEEELPPFPNAKLSYLDAAALKFWNKRRTDFTIPSYYGDSAFGRNVEPARLRLQAGGYLTVGDIQENIKLKTVPELKAVLAEKELKTSGKKGELVQRLIHNLTEDELYDLFPVGVYQITEAGEAALAEYDIVFENQSYNLGFSYYRLMSATAKYPETGYADILVKLLNEDIQECYQTGDKDKFQRLLPKAAVFLEENGQPGMESDVIILSYFVWTQEVNLFGPPEKNGQNQYLSRNVEKYGVLCGLSLEEILVRFREIVHKNNPFCLGTKVNTERAVSALKTGLGIK